jgi:hypothetical protein
VEELLIDNSEMAIRWKPEWDVSIEMMKEAGIQLLFLTKKDLTI